MFVNTKTFPGFVREGFPFSLFFAKNILKIFCIVLCYFEIYGKINYRNQS